MHFQRNLHSVDRAARLVLGLACVYFGFVDTSLVGSSVAATLVGLFGILNLFAAVSSHCPVYHATGISTYRHQQRKTT